MIEQQHRAPELVVERTLDAPRELVFQVWTQVEHLERWCCPTGFTIPFSEGEIREGGWFRTCMRSPDGEDHWLKGEYLEIVPPERLVFTHAWLSSKHGRAAHQTIVTLTLQAQGGKTRLRLHQAFFESEAARDGHRSGWQATLDELERYLAS